METGILKPEWEEEATSLVDLDSQVWWASLPPDAKARICMGLAWEDFYIASQLPEVIDHPGEVERDGILMTPDGEELVQRFIDGRNRYTLVGHEIKCTYKSMNTVMTKPWQQWDGKIYDSTIHGLVGPMQSQYMWLAQCIGYAAGKGLTEYSLHALFAAGDYSYPIKPVAYRFDMTFTEAEVERSWAQTTEYKDYCILRGPR